MPDPPPATPAEGSTPDREQPRAQPPKPGHPMEPGEAAAAGRPARDRPPQPDLRARLGWELAAFLELVALCGFVIAQPVLDATGRSPDVFLFYQAGPVEIAAMVVLVCLAPPLVLWGVGALAGLGGDRARRAAHVLLVGALAALLALVVAKQLVSVRGVVLAAAALAAGGGLAWLYAKAPVLGQFLRFAAAGPLVFAALFVFASPAGALLRPASESAGPPPAAADPLTAAGGGSRQAHPPVVVLLLDELPLVALLGQDGEIDAERYPNFAALARQAHWFRNATAVSGYSPVAIPSMLSGRNPAAQVAPHYREYPDNLFTLLGGDYQLSAHESITLLCPPEHCPEAHAVTRGGLPAVLREAAGLLGQVLSPRDRHVDPTQMYQEPTERRARRVELGTEFRFDQLHVNQPSRYQDFLERLRPSDRPTLHYLHLLLPHAPWRYLPSGLQYHQPESFIAQGPPSGRTEWWMRTNRQRLQLQLAYTDQLLGGIVRTLKQRGMYDQAALVVTSDHGVSLRAGTPARFLPGKPDGDPAMLEAAAELLWVPLLVKEPGQSRGVVDDRNVQQVDLLPTLADLAGVRVPWPTDGVSALGAPRAGTAKRFWDDPGKVRTVDGRAGLDLVLRGLQGAEQVRPELLGRPLEEFTVSEGGTTAEVYGLDWFQDVQPTSGTVPALVGGTVPDATPASEVVVAVNGRIGAVATLSHAELGRRWFAGLISDARLFTAGANRLEILRVTGEEQLERLHLEGVPAGN